MVLQSTLHNLNSSLSRLQHSQQDMSTGRSLRKMSDDPTRGISAMTTRNELRRSEQRSRTADHTQSVLAVADNALVSSLDILARAKELTVRASNTGLLDATARDVIGSELSSIREELIAVANTKHLNRPIFNGTAAGAAYDTSSGAYLGNAAIVVRDVGPGTTVTANMTGEQIFGAQTGLSGDLFAVLDRLATAVASGDSAAIAIEHTNLDAATTRVGSAAAEIGTRAARLDGIRSRSAADELGLRDRLSGLEDIDLAEAILATQTHENAYTAALQAAARVIPPSLVDYLR
jgi:flagellar hook-associated protein 3 FlgL